MNIDQLSAIVAVANNGTIGRGNALPWKLRSDLQRFKRITMGHSLIMGRKTYESIGRALPGRQTIILSRQMDHSIDGVQIASTFEDAMNLVPKYSIAFIAGGAEIYELAMHKIQHLYMTRVLANVVGDKFLPAWDLSEFDCVEKSYTSADENNEFPSEFQHLVRRKI